MLTKFKIDSFEEKIRIVKIYFIYNNSKALNIFVILFNIDAW